MLPGGGSGACSEVSGRRSHTRRPAATLARCGASPWTPRAASTLADHPQFPDCPMPQDRSRNVPCSRGWAVATSRRRRRMISIRAPASASRVVGRSIPTASARPRTVGRQNVAGRTKANSSSTSWQGNRSVFSRVATAGACARIGRSRVALCAACASVRSDTSPSGVNRTARRSPATSTGLGGMCRRGWSGPEAGGAALAAKSGVMTGGV